jgi:hypothetical protein
MQVRGARIRISRRSRLDSSSIRSSLRTESIDFPRLKTSRSGMALCNAGEGRPPGSICIRGLTGLGRRFCTLPDTRGRVLASRSHAYAVIIMKNNVSMMIGACGLSRRISMATSCPFISGM